MSHREIINQAAIVIGVDPFEGTEPDYDSDEESDGDRSAAKVTCGVLRAAGKHAAELQRSEPVISGLFDAQGFQE